MTSRRDAHAHSRQFEANFGGWESSEVKGVPFHSIVTLTSLDLIAIVQCVNRFHGGFMLQI